MIKAEHIFNQLSSEVLHKKSLRLLCVLVYFWFLINILMVWNVKELLWGVNNVFYRHGHTDTFVENFFYQLIYDATRFRLIFWTHFVCALLSLINSRWSFIPRILTWCTAWILFYAAIEAFNSGMMLMIELALYCSVINTEAKTRLEIVLTNLAGYAAMVQICLVYLVAATYKLSGEQWLNGSAIYYTLHIHQFASEFWTKSGLTKMNWLMMLMTYSALLYQLTFPIVVWFKKTRSWFLVIGIAFHLFIGIFLHLWDFALAMIFAYAVFLPENISGKILNGLRLPFKKRNST